MLWHYWGWWGSPHCLVKGEVPSGLPHRKVESELLGDAVTAAKKQLPGALVELGPVLLSDDHVRQRVLGLQPDRAVRADHLDWVERQVDPDSYSQVTVSGRPALAALKGGEMVGLISTRKAHR